MNDVGYHYVVLTLVLILTTLTEAQTLLEYNASGTFIKVPELRVVKTSHIPNYILHKQE